jgi:hypothetical protein
LPRGSPAPICTRVSKPHPYRGRTALLASMHGKEAALAAPLQEALGLMLIPAAGFDTDRFGTFTGEVERTAPPRETALAKARAALAAQGGDLAIASEGSFGPHPGIPFLALAAEWVVFIDRARGLEIAIEHRSIAMCGPATASATFSMPWAFPRMH